MAVNQVRMDYLSTFKSNPNLQVLDLGTQISREPPKNFSRKSEILINMFSGKHIGYKMEMKNLLYKQWKKWVYENPSFKVSDVLSMSEVKAAIKEFYRRVLTGEMYWEDDSKMLELIQHQDGLLEIRIVPFKEGLFAIKEENSKEKEEVKTPSMVERLKDLLSIAETPEEQKAIEKALSMLSTSLIKKVV